MTSLKMWKGTYGVEEAFIYIFTYIYLIKALYLEYIINSCKSLKDNIGKWAKYLKQELQKIYIQTDKKYVKKCSALCVIREIQMKPQWEITTYPIKWQKYKKL